MSVSQNVITIDVGSHEPSDYLARLHESIGAAKMLIFERRTLDLDEPETHALLMLTDLQMRIVKGVEK